MPPEHAYLIEFTDPGDEFSFPGTSSTTVMAHSPEHARIKAYVWYYGETKPTVTPEHELRIVLL